MRTMVFQRKPKHEGDIQHEVPADLHSSGGGGGAGSSGNNALGAKISMFGALQVCP
jgi:hypothetical protein